MLIKIPKIEESKQTPEVKQLLVVMEQLFIELEKQVQEVQKLKESNALLREEIDRLKKHKGKPNIKPSTMEKGTSQGNGKGEGRNQQNAVKKELKQERMRIAAKNVPEGSRFKGFQKYEVQEIVIEGKKICYYLERWKLPNGEYLVAKLPETIKGYHFGPMLRSYIDHQYSLGVTQPQILEQLQALGIKISAGELNHLLVDNKEEFHKEKDEILGAGLNVSSYINVDDTGARHNGKNGYCTHIGNELFAWFSSTESKSRINFLSLLRQGYQDYVVDENALLYMKQEKLPQQQLDLLQTNQKMIANMEEWKRYLQDLGIQKERLVKIITEGALVGSVLVHGFSIDLKIVSDDAGQFNIFRHALCWIHAERGINKLIPLNDDHAVDIKLILDKFWSIYRDLKAYKLQPTAEESTRMEKCFDEMCNTKTSYQTLNETLKRLAKNKQELLLVLKYPELPLHNNLSENDIREYVKRRKISGGTRSDRGRRYRDTFISLKKTCRKLGINFWEYLLDRNHKTGKVSYLPDLVRTFAIDTS